jgi:formate hydrogenlyase subunit 3/multisubunit Na+/H+ antiporter MnhD subunit
LFDIWLATLLLGPLVLTALVAYFSWRRLAHPKLYVLIGVVGLWAAAITVAMRVLGNVGVSGGVGPDADHGARVLGASMLIFLLVGIAFLLGLRYFMRKRRASASAE